MNNKNKLSSISSVHESGVAVNSIVLADIAVMKDVVREFQAEMEEAEDDDENLILVFHVSIIWPTALLSLFPSINVSIKLKEESEDVEVASWERIIHKSDSAGWEQSLALIMHAVRELKLDYFIMENVEAQERRGRWLQ